MPTAYYKSQDKNFTLLQGDCIELLNSFEFKFDMIFADPPYHLSNGGISIQSGVPVSVNKGKWDKSQGFEEDYKFDKTWLAACREHLKSDGTIWVSGTYHNIFSVARCLTELDFKILNCITWVKTNLPFDTDVQRDRGTRTILLENIINAKYNHIVYPTGRVLLESDNEEHLSQDAFFWNIVFREVAHGLGVKETVNGKGSVQDALGSAAPTFEEIKANAAGVLLVCKLQNHYDIRHLFTKDDALVTFFASLVRSERFGDASSLGRASIIIYNYLQEAGAFKRKESGHYSLDLAKMEAALSDLTALVLKTQATGDREFAVDFEKRYSKRSANYDADLMSLGLEKIPADIRFK